MDTGYLKSFICQKIGLGPERHKLFFTCKEKEDDEDLQAAGLTDNSEVLLMEAKACQQESPEEMHETSVISKGEEAVAQVRNEVDKLARQVCAMQALVDRGIKVGDKEVGYLSEMLMRQLLKLDGIEAEGEGRVQRKMEVRRVQSLVETLDVLKSINSNDFSSASKSLTPDLSYNIPSSYVPFSVPFQMPSSSKI
ncbi:hypothetical protein OROMI_029236 [Orobanche minor]